MPALFTKMSIYTRLLERTTRQVNLTPDGERFYERCSRLLSDLDEIKNLFKESTPAGVLRVNLQGTIVRSLHTIPAGKTRQRPP